MKTGFQQMTTSIAHQAKAIVQNLNGIFPAFTTSAIGSDDYKDKAMTVHGNVTALAQLHPNWSDEKKIILNSQENELPNLNEDDLFILIYDYTEELFQAWRDMRVTRPSIASLSNGGATFRVILDSLHAECMDLTNRRAARYFPVAEDPEEPLSCTCTPEATPVTDVTTN
jgi:hypothetical protein